jgi:hypothetical protein
MANRSRAPAVLLTDPLTLPCPFCGAKRGKDCSTSAGGFSVLHLVRIKAAASLDAQAAKQKSPRNRSSVNPPPKM